MPPRLKKNGRSQKKIAVRSRQARWPSRGWRRCRSELGRLVLHRRAQGGTRRSPAPLDGSERQPQQFRRLAMLQSLIKARVEDGAFFHRQALGRLMERRPAGQLGEILFTIEQVSTGLFNRLVDA